MERSKAYVGDISLSSTHLSRAGETMGIIGSSSARWQPQSATGSESETRAVKIAKFRRSYDACYGDLWLYCLRRTSSRSKAEEVLGDTFTTAWEKIDEMPLDDEARPWLYGIARNYVRNEWRKTKRRDAVDLRLVADAARSEEQSTVPGPETLALDATDTIVAAFKSLRISDQEILSLASWEKLSNSDIGLTLSCSENAAKIRLHRARKRLLKALKKQSGVLADVHKPLTKTIPIKEIR